MDSSTSLPTASTSTQRPPRPQFQRGRGRGGALRGRGERQRGRGGSSRGNGRQQHGQEHEISSPENGDNGTSKPLLLSPRIQPQQPGEPQQDGETAIDEQEAEVCFICASPVTHQSVAPCNHRTCHICSLRLRVLYKTNACAHCRTESPYVIFTDEPEKRYEDFTTDDFQKSDDTLGIKYEKNDIYEDTVLLLRYNCPEPTCDVACFGWPDLHRHVKTQHQKVMCDLCTRNKKVFTHEHELFTGNSLRKHERYGDDNPGAVDQSGFKGHPECGFCRQRFYGDDELYAHCRDRHERCHICDRQSQPGSRHQQYYLDYNALEIHFSKDHYLCPDKECLEKKFVVFESEMDLKGHQLEAHPNGLTKDARRDARRVDMSGFDYRNSHQQDQRTNRREGRGRGRGRDPNANDNAPLPSSSAQPLRRDQIAYQRQLAIHSAQNVSTRNFGGQLTRNDAVAARLDPSTSAPATVTAPREGSHTSPLPSQSQPSTTPASSLPNISSLDLSSSAPPANTAHLTPAERARLLRHAALTERAANLLGHSEPKLSTFRSRISAYKTGSITAQGLIDAFFALFECPTADLGTLIKELADAFEVPGKADDLRRAWNDWRAINEDYPSLPGSGVAENNMSAAGGKRILKLKSSTAQSSRSAVGRSGSWGSGAGFPALPKGTNTTRSKPAWLPMNPVPSSEARGSAQVKTPVSPAPRRAPAGGGAGGGGGGGGSVTGSGRTVGPGSDAFPALPAAQKPGMNISRPGYAGSPVKREGPGVGMRAWGPGSGFASGAATAPNGSGGDGGGGTGSAAALDGDFEEAGKKGKGKKKQTLIHWG
ncbi:MAG: hypothetical protein Q9162_000729 [Coniocarpon cinnabarinum]